jgi:hypothetical protein
MEGEGECDVETKMPGTHGYTVNKDAGNALSGSVIKDAANADRCRTPPCFAFPSKREYEFEPVYAPVIAREPNRSNKKISNTAFIYSINSKLLSLEPLGNVEKEIDPSQNSKWPVDVRNVNSGHNLDVGTDQNSSSTLTNNTARQCSKIISKEVENEETGKESKKRKCDVETKQKVVPSENILGAFKCVKVRKQE